MGSSGRAVGFCGGLLTLVVLTTGVLMVQPPATPLTQVRNFQQLVGGVGLGATVVPAWSFHAFDPRLDPACASDNWPNPGGPCYSPDHVGPLSEFWAPPPDGVSMILISPGRAPKP